MDDIDDILASVSAPAHDPRLLDTQALTRAWINERSAPELLPWPDALMSRTMARLRDQIDQIENLASSMDPSSNFRLVILQTELERFKFLIRSYLRARIAKLDQFAQYYLRTTDSTLLSELEQQYLESHNSLLTTHFNAAFLTSFPTSLQRLDDASGGVSMIDAPEFDSAVFVRVLRDGGTLDVYGQDSTSEIELRRGDIWVLRWRSVSDKVRTGDLELI